MRDLYWPPGPESIVSEEARLHALVVGVGDYPHLGGGSGQPAPKLLELQQLTSSRRTALEIARWLVDKYNNPDCPLGSVELLLSPGGPVKRPNGRLNGEIDIQNATMSAVCTAVDRWFDRCGTHPSNIALLYFAGHGINKGTSQFLLPADFGSTHAAFWRNCIDFESFKLGMRQNRAATQLFFVDACQETPITMLSDLRPSGDPIISGADFHHLVTTEGTFRASSIGRKAYGLPNEITFFGKALMQALSGVGARNPDGSIGVDTDSLCGALGPLMDELAIEYDLPLSCQCTSQRQRPSVIHRPESLLVRASISSARERIDADFQLSRGPDTYRSLRGEPRPWVHFIPPGDWTVQAEYSDSPAISRQETISPPTQRIRI